MTSILTLAIFLSLNVSNITCKSTKNIIFYNYVSIKDGNKEKLQLYEWMTEPLILILSLSQSAFIFLHRSGLISSE